VADLARLGFDVDTGGLREGQRELRGLSGQSDRTTSSVSKLGGAIRALAGALAIGAAFRTIIRNTVEQERVTAQLDQTLRSTGRYTAELSQGLQDYASALQAVTAYGDEAVIASQSLLLSFTQIGEEAFPRAQEAVLNVATAIGTDLKSAAIQVGKALNDPVIGLTALSRSGITFSESQKDIIKQMVKVGDVAGAQSAILDELETQFGGSARAARDTLGGALQSLSNTFGDLLEGKQGDGGISGATEGIKSLTETLNNPQVVAGFNALVEGALNAIGVIARFSAETAGFAKWAGEELASITAGAAPDDIIRLRDELDLLYDMLDNPSKRIRFFGKDGAVVYYNKDEILDMIADTEVTLVRARDELNRKLAGVSTGGGTGMVITVPRLERPTESTGPTEESIKAQKDLEDQLARRRDALMQSLESEKHTALRIFGERDAEISALEDARWLTEMQAADLRIQNEIEKSNQLTEIHRRGIEEKEAAEAGYWERWLEGAEANLSNFNQLSEGVINNFTSGFGNALESVVLDFESVDDAAKVLFESLIRGTVNALGQMAAQWLAYQLVQSAMATSGAAGAASAMVAEAAAKQQMAALGAFSATAAIPVVGPALAPAAAAAALAATSPFVAGVAALSSSMVASSTVASFEGGGFTGSGSRSGGMDGKGGFPAMLHPNETVIDHTKGQGQGVVININNAPQGTRAESRQGADGQQVIEVFVADMNSGGPMSKTMQSTFGMRRQGR